MRIKVTFDYEINSDLIERMYDRDCTHGVILENEKNSILACI